MKKDVPPNKESKPLSRLRLIAIDMAIAGSERTEIVEAVTKAASPDDIREGFAYWARHLARDVVAAAHKAGGASPRAGSVDGQTDFGWANATVDDGLAAIDRYCHRYAKVVEKYELGRRVAARVRTYRESHEVAGAKLLEVARQAGVSAEDLLALVS